MRVGIIYPVPEPLAPANWSGTPHGLASGFAACGVDVVPIGVKVPHGLHELVAVLSRSTGRRGAVADRMQIRQWARTRALRTSLRQHQPLDAVIAMGTEMYDLARILDKVGAVRNVRRREHFCRCTVTPIPTSASPSFPNATLPDGSSGSRHRATPRPSVVSARVGRHDPMKTTTEFRRARLQSWEWATGHVSLRRVSRRDWSRPRFLFVGVDWRRKNGAAVLDAFEEVRRVVPAASLDLVGNHPEIDAPGVTCPWLPRQGRRRGAAEAGQPLRGKQPALCCRASSTLLPLPIWRRHRPDCR